MVTRVQKEQVESVVAAWVGVNSFSATGASSNVSAAISTALSTAGENNQTKAATAVPVQPSVNKGVGIIVSGVTARVEIWDSATKDKIDQSGREVYGRLTHSGGVYTLTYYYVDAAGAETAYTFASAVTIDFEIGYRFDYHLRPVDYAIAGTARRIIQDPEGTGGGKTFTIEALNITSLNTIADLNDTPDNPLTVTILVNGVEYHPLGGTEAAFVVSGNSITWRPDKAKLNLQTTYDAIAKFYIA